MVELYNGDCLPYLKQMKDKSVDLVVIDPPYEIDNSGGGGAFGTKKREYQNELYKSNLNVGITNEVLIELSRIMKKINIYIWCNKNQLLQYMQFFKDYNIDLLTWHKTNPTPQCNNKYLSDTEYLLFFRESSVKVYGNYETKKKYYISPTNTEDKKIWNHPTIKPIEIIKNLIINSSKEGDTVLDCYMGSGTTGVACKLLNRDFIGCEIDKTYYDIARKRIDEAREQMTIYDFMENK